MALTKTPIELSSTPSIVDGGNATAITIDSSENVGIGTSSPASALHVDSGTANNVATFSSTDAYALIKFEDNDTTTETTLGALDNDMVFRVGAAERMRIVSDGNVEMRGSANVRISLGTAGGSGANNSSNWIYGNGTNLRFNNAGGYYSWETLGTERMRIDSSGNVGIGVSPSTKLHVLGGRSTFYSGDNYAVGVGNASGVLGGYMGSPAVNVLSFSEPGGVERMRIDSSGNVLVGTTSSSGDTANDRPVVAGNFTTKYGTTSIASQNTWTTVHTFGSNQGNFMVSMRASGTGNIAHNSVSIVAINGSATTHTPLLSGSAVQIRIVGLSLQVYQNVFAGANINWSIMSIGN